MNRTDSFYESCRNEKLIPAARPVLLRSGRNVKQVAFNGLAFHLQPVDVYQAPSDNRCRRYIAYQQKVKVIVFLFNAALEFEGKANGPNRVRTCLCEPHPFGMLTSG